MKRAYKKKTVTRPGKIGCLCHTDDLPEGVSHTCSRFTQLRPVTTGHLKWRRGNNGKPVFETGTWTSTRDMAGRVRHLQYPSGKLVAEIDHGDNWPATMEDWVECYRDHRLSSVLLPPPDPSSSLDVADPWKGAGVGLLTGVKSNGLFAIVCHTEAAAYIAPNWLLPTQRIHGRSDSPKRYWWYMKAPVPPTMTFRDASGTVLVDVQGEGCMTTVPPTVHASGEPLEWQTLFPVDTSRCWSSDTFEEDARNFAACTLVAGAWPDDESQSSWMERLVDCLISADFSSEFVAHFVASAALVPEDDWYEVHAAVLEHVAESTPKDASYRWDVELAEVLGKDTANLLVNWLNLCPRDASHEVTEVGEVRSEENLDLGFLEEGVNYGGEPIEEFHHRQD